jgi:hypothetical protein
MIEAAWEAVFWQDLLLARVAAPRHDLSLGPPQALGIRGRSLRGGRDALSRGDGAWRGKVAPAALPLLTVVACSTWAPDTSIADYVWRPAEIGALLH